jgi:hypothetical protein
MEMKVVIGIEIEGTKLILTEEAARELYQKLDKMFGSKVISYPWIYPTYPVHPAPWNPVWITSTGSGNTLDSYTVTSQGGVNVSYSVV